MIFDQSRLAFSFAKNISSSASTDVATHNTLIAEKKDLSALYEKQQKGARLAQRDLHKNKFNKQSSDFAYRVFKSKIVDNYLNFKILCKPGYFNEELTSLFDKHTPELFSLMKNKSITISAENINDKGYEISAVELLSLLNGSISFEAYGKELFDSIGESYEPLPSRISVSGDGLVNFCEAALISYNLKTNWDKIFLEISNFYLALYTEDNPELNHHAKYLLDFFTEPVEDFELKFEDRKKQSMSAQNMNEEEYFVEQIKLLENCKTDLDNFQSSVDGKSISGNHIFKILCLAQDKIGQRKLYYSLKRKLEIVEGNKVYINFLDDIGDADKSMSKKETTTNFHNKQILKLKNSLDGLPKQVKLLNLNQTKSNILLSNGKDPLSDFVDQLDALIDEIESNHEAYENKNINSKYIPFVYDRPLDWYFNVKNIPNQDLVFATYDYFNDGLRKELFEPLFFLNFMYCQFDMVKLSFETPFKVLDKLKTLPINKEEQHIILGFILKWFGGYPVNNLEPQLDTTLRFIEREFLSYPTETPEKKFCHRDMDDYIRLKQLENYLNLKINNPDTQILAPEGFQTTAILKVQKKEGLDHSHQNNEPYFVDEYKTQIVEILKPYFEIGNHLPLNELICTSATPEKKLFFKSNGNRLAVAFKMLIEENIITQCTKKQLEDWIQSNFTFQSNSGEKEYERKYLNDIISSQSSTCKKPLFFILVDSIDGKKILKKV